MSEAITARPDTPTLLGIVACALPVAAFSSYSQYMTAQQAGMPWQLAWVLPMATDATAYVSTRVWLTPQYSDGIRRYAATIALSCILLSVAGASVHLAVPELPWSARLVVGGLPSAALAALVHLGALVSAARNGNSEKFQAAPRKPRRTRAAQPVIPAPADHAPTRTPVALERDEPDATPVGGSVLTLDATKGALRHQMYAYLDKHPNATGAELDRKFDTKDYGRTVLRTWRKHRDQASGE